MTTDDVQRHALEREVHRLIYADQAYLFLGKPPLLDAFRKRVTGITYRRGRLDLAALELTKE